MSATTEREATELVVPIEEHPPWVAVAMYQDETEGLDFVATGKTGVEAVAALLEGWRAHAFQTGADPDHLHEEDLTVREGPLGSVWRDGLRMFTS